jgi:hypothetical protein
MEVGQEEVLKELQRVREIDLLVSSLSKMFQILFLHNTWILHVTKSESERNDSRTFLQIRLQGVSLQT